MSAETSYLQHLKSLVVVKKNVFVAENATVLGQVELNQNVSIWYGAVVRGDNDSIVIGAFTNIQDNCIIHVDEGVPVKIGEQCVVGHRAILHGCTVGNTCLIGMGAIIMNNAVIGDNCVIGANALVTENTVIPPGSLVLGSPGKVVRQVNPNQIERIKKGALHYAEEAQKYLVGNFNTT